jgi:hypothetical protein
MPSLSTPETAELKRLAADPDAQAAYAATLLSPKTARPALQAALDVLVRRPTSEARPALLALYKHFDADGRKRDPGAYVRRLIVAALRGILLPVDTPLLLHAVATVERLPPAFKDEAIPLRATGLVALNEADPDLAGYHAARLLADPNADRMSGEPCLTAARVLASQESLLPLYACAMQEGGPELPEVVGECLRSLTGIPTPLLPGLVERRGKDEHTLVLVGLCDLLIAHREGPQQADYLRSLLATSQDPDLVRYLALALLARRDEALRDMALAAARTETHPGRAAALREALAPFAGDRAVAEVLEGLVKGDPSPPAKPVQ